MSAASQLTYASNRHILTGPRQREVYDALFEFEHLRPGQGLMHGEIWTFIKRAHNYPADYRDNCVARLCELRAKGMVTDIGADGEEARMYARAGSSDVCTLWQTVDIVGLEVVPKTALRTFWLVQPRLRGSATGPPGRSYRNQVRAREVYALKLGNNEDVVLIEAKEVKKRTRADATVLEFVPLLPEA